MNSAIQRYREDEGFTLIELLVVVIIIGILAAIAIPAFLNQRENAYYSAAESDVRNAAIEVESEFTREGCYPGTAAPCTADTFATLLTNEIEASNNVTLTYALGAGNNSFSITATHALISSGTVNAARYCSADGGVQSDPTAACPTS